MDYPEKKKKDVGVDEKKHEASRIDEKKKVLKEEKRYKVVFKSNRLFELQVGREMIRFEGYGLPVSPAVYTESLPEKIIKHPDFQLLKNRFNVTEV